MESKVPRLPAMPGWRQCPESGAMLAVGASKNKQAKLAKGVDEHAKEISELKAQIKKLEASLKKAVHRIDALEKTDKKET